MVVSGAIRTAVLVTEILTGETFVAEVLGAKLLSWLVLVTRATRSRLPWLVSSPSSSMPRLGKPVIMRLSLEAELKQISIDQGQDVNRKLLMRYP